MRTMRLVTWILFGVLWLFMIAVVRWRMRRKRDAGRNDARLAVGFVEQLAAGIAATATGSTLLSFAFFGSVAAPALLILGIIVRTLNRRPRRTA